LREHLIAYVLLPLFELLDRERFELYAYALSPEDGSDIRAKLVASADHFRCLQTMSDADAAAAIRGDDIDILVDLAGHTTGGRFAITARRPGRLQVVYLGFPGSLGSTRVDYAIVDRIVGNTTGEWTEALVSLPYTYFLYDFRQSVPQSSLRRKDYALPEDAFVYCAFHKPEKISPDTFELWSAILTRVPQSVLWLRAMSARTMENLRAHAAQCGIDPARLLFAPFEQRNDPRYMARQRLGDVMLDALHHNAITTACDALAAELPVLTLRGSAMASRSGESLLRAAGLPELVAPDKEEFIARAVNLALDPGCLRNYRRALSERAAPLFDTAGRVRALERAFLGMYERMMRGEPPAAFDV
jgi:predicted O-linked N-acetylglucosamine transferase (SPINDLY family)